MPELPEVETLRRDLEKEIVGKKIKSVDVTGKRSTRRHKTSDDFVKRVEGTKVTEIRRRGKYLLLVLDSGDVMVVHLGMSGQLVRAKGKEEVDKHTHVVVTFTQGGQLRYVDPRTFGELFVTTPENLQSDVPELAHLGIDPFEDAVSWVEFGQMLLARKAKLKSLLTDQEFIAGIGNIYADEILWEAGLRWDRSSDTLTSQEIRRLCRAMTEVLQEAIKQGGSTLSDGQYKDLFGEEGSYQGEHKVYDREGQPCVRCRSLIAKEKNDGRSTYFCPSCQV
jgi:formamidopyrimidine-DNA glycosylase